MQRGKAVLGAAAIALMVGCTGGPERASSTPEVEDRPVPGTEPTEAAGGSGTEGMGATGTLADAGGVEGSPLAAIGADGEELTLVIYFDFDSSEVHPDDRVVVEAHAQYLARNAGVEVVLEGMPTSAARGSTTWRWESSGQTGFATCSGCSERRINRFAP